MDVRPPAHLAHRRPRLRQRHPLAARAPQGRLLEAPQPLPRWLLPDPVTSPPSAPPARRDEGPPRSLYGIGRLADHAHALALGGQDVAGQVDRHHRPEAALAALHQAAAQRQLLADRDRAAQPVAHLGGHPPDAVGRAGVDEHLVDEHPDQAAVDAVRVADLGRARRVAGDGVGAVAVDPQVQPLRVGRSADQAVRELGRVEERQIVHGGARCYRPARDRLPGRRPLDQLPCC